MRAFKVIVDNELIQIIQYSLQFNCHFVISCKLFIEVWEMKGLHTSTYLEVAAKTQTEHCGVLGCI